MPFIGADGFVYVDQKVLAGFTPDALRAAFLDDYFSGCGVEEKERVLRDVAAAQEFCSKLNDGRPNAIVFKEVPAENSEYLKRLSASQTFQQLIGANYQFAIADLRDAIAVQPNVVTEASETKALPSSPGGPDLVRYCLADQYTFQLQVTVNTNQVIFSGLDNNLAGAAFVQQPGGGVPAIVPLSRGNWVQVGRSQGKAFLLNGYHRVAKLIEAGTFEIPCIVRDFATPEQMGLGLGRFFDLTLLQKASRPPLLRDFVTPAAIRLPGKRIRSTILANLQVTGINNPG